MRFGDCPPFEEKPTKVTKGESETGVELEVGGGSRFPGRWEAYFVPPQGTKVKETRENAVGWQIDGHCCAFLVLLLL